MKHATAGPDGVWPEILAASDFRAENDAHAGKEPGRARGTGHARPHNSAYAGRWPTREAQPPTCCRSSSEGVR
jgi:hypothetical protein